MTTTSQPRIYGDLRDEEIARLIDLVRATGRLERDANPAWEMLPYVSDETLAWLFARDVEMTNADAVATTERYIRENF